MTTYEKIVKGATKVKVAAPKPKYIEPILMATSMDHSIISADNFNTIMRTLQQRLRDNSWSVVYKSLIVIHLMIREGDKDVALRYLANQGHSMLNLSSSNIASNNSGNYNADVRLIMKYSKYLHTRVKQFDATGIDYVRDERSNNSTTQEGGRLRSLSTEKGLLRETESVQKQIDSLLKNSFMENDINNDIVLTAFRLLVNDLLALFQELNEGVINILEHYFEMSKYDAERSLKVYKKFVDQTKYVIDYLRVAKHLEYATKLHVPTIKHAPTALTSSLEEYLDDPNFEANRRQYLAEKGNKQNADSPKKPIFGNRDETKTTPQQTQQQQQQQQQQQKELSQQQLPQQTLSNGGASGVDRHASLVVQQTYNPWNNIAIPVYAQAYTQQSQVDPYQLQQQQQQEQAQQQQQAQLQAQQQQQAQQLQAQQQQQAQLQIQQQQQAQLQAQQQQEQAQQQAQQQQLQQQQQQLQQQQQHTFGHQSRLSLPPIIQGQPYQSPMHTSYTGTGFGGYGSQTTLQPQLTNPMQQPLQPQSTNPFLQQQQQPQYTSTQFQQQTPLPLQHQNTNPFLQKAQQVQTAPAMQQHQQPQFTSQFTQPQMQLQSQSSPGLQRSNTNPFARIVTGQQNTQPQGGSFFGQQQPQQQQSIPPLQHQSTNPFARRTFDPNVDSLI
ncbi:ANTH domain family protein [Candida parapsilosis]|uniref:ANTH domain family protein n=1 Tax=Candida parapsilosis TaxID=5480 RepID=A0A8X7NK32_CANPA|nr:ANTH domain family protein [Candida parapsilosis]KAF6047547.1 ANTH domain family protein [Candida parapsilosis]KAF6050483.1 ANTH domain family protein [Candida parapsilosis]KAF6061604.1 ANTH domain family protein [Candida parapsilosis]